MSPQSSCLLPTARRGPAAAVGRPAGDLTRRPAVHRPGAAVVLTGGTIGIEVLARIGASAAARRSTGAGSRSLGRRTFRARRRRRAERETGPARRCWTTSPVDPALVHPMAAVGRRVRRRRGRGGRRLRRPGRRRWRFRRQLLGMGPEGHVASMFPELPGGARRADRRSPVRNCPKPPPTRISLTLPTIRNVREVWVVAGGGARRRRSRWRSAAPARSRSRPSGAVGTPGRCGCSTGTRGCEVALVGIPGDPIA